MNDRKPTKSTAATRGMQGSEATNRTLAELERRMLALKRDFEMYFNGFEKLPPLDKFEMLKRDVRGLTEVNYATAVLRFKVTTFIARFNQFRTLWDRQLLQFEQGAFKSGRRVSLVGHRPRGTPDDIGE